MLDHFWKSPSKARNAPHKSSLLRGDSVPLLCNLSKDFDFGRPGSSSEAVCPWDNGSRWVEIDVGIGGTLGIVSFMEGIERMELSGRRDFAGGILPFSDWLVMCPSTSSDSLVPLVEFVVGEGDASRLGTTGGVPCSCNALFPGGGDREGAIHD